MAIQTREVAGFTEDKIQLIKNTVARGCTDSELDLFIHSCKRLGLDPFMRQIYAVKRGTGPMTIQTGIDGYRLIAERSGKYMPGREPTFIYDGKQLISATAYIKRLGPDSQWHEIAATSFMSEYEVTTSPTWKKMPHVMLAKCAESAALRRAFPAEMSGVYTEEEMAQADVQKAALNAQQPNISAQEAMMLETLIGTDFEYKKRILEFYKIDSFTQLKADKFDMIVERIHQYNDRKKDKELIVEEDPDA